MYKLILIILSFTFVLKLEAQPKLGGNAQRITSINRGGINNGGKSNVIVVAPAPVYRYNPYVGLGYRNFYGYGFGYRPYYDPFYSYQRVEREPSELDLEIEDIKEEYSFKIDTVKDDKSLSKDERKQKVRDLKHEREDAIIEAKKQYYKKKEQKRDKE